MTCPPRPSIAARELWFRGIPPDDDRQDREDRHSAADGSPLSFLRVCWQSMWPISRNRRRNGPRLVVAPPRQSIGDDQATNGEPAEEGQRRDRKSTRLNSSHLVISYAVFCLKKKKITYPTP